MNAAKENNNIKEQKLVSCWWKYNNIRNSRFRKL